MAGSHVNPSRHCDREVVRCAVRHSPDTNPYPATRCTQLSSVRDFRKLLYAICDMCDMYDVEADGGRWLQGQGSRGHDDKCRLITSALLHTDLDRPYKSFRLLVIACEDGPSTLYKADHQYRLTHEHPLAAETMQKYTRQPMRICPVAMVTLASAAARRAHSSCLSICTLLHVFDAKASDASLTQHSTSLVDRSEQDVVFFNIDHRSVILLHVTTPYSYSMCNNSSFPHRSARRRPVSELQAQA